MRLCSTRPVCTCAVVATGLCAPPPPTYPASVWTGVVPHPPRVCVPRRGPAGQTLRLFGGTSRLGNVQERHGRARPRDAVLDGPREPWRAQVLRQERHLRAGACGQPCLPRRPRPPSERVDERASAESPSCVATAVALVAKGWGTPWAPHVPLCVAPVSVHAPPTAVHTLAHTLPVRGGTNCSLYRASFCGRWPRRSIHSGNSTVLSSRSAWSRSASAPRSLWTRPCTGPT